MSTGHRPAATARAADCAEWNTRKFFKQATLEEVQGCLAAGAEVNARTVHGITPLHSAAGISPLVVIELLLGAGALVNVQDKYGWTPLHNAAQINNDPAVIRALVSAGAEVDAQDESGWTPLHWAAQSTDNPAIVIALLEAGADALAHNVWRETPWDYAQNNDALEGTDAWRRLQSLAGQ